MNDISPAIPPTTTKAPQGTADYLCSQVDARIAQAVRTHRDASAGGATTAIGDPDGWTAVAEAFASLPLGARLRTRYEIDDFGCAILGLLLADSIDPNYASVWAYLSDDGARRQPSLDLALTVFGCDRSSRLSAVYEWAAGPLIRNRLVDPPHATPLTPLRLDAQVRALFLPTAEIDPQLLPFCRLRPPVGGDPAQLLPPTLEAQLTAQEKGSIRVHLRGPSGSGKYAIAAAIAGRCQMRLLHADFALLLRERAADDVLLRRLCREAYFRAAVLLVGGIDSWESEHSLGRLGEALAAALAEHPIHVVFASRSALPESWRLPGGVLRVCVDRPAAVARRDLWRETANRAGLYLTEQDINSLATRYSLSARQIAQAADDALASGRQNPGIADCESAARALTGHALERLARRVSPGADWQDLIVPADVEAQLREIGQRVIQRTAVAEICGEERRLLRERGITALFAGPSGTGKTLAAEVIAGTLGLDLFCIDLAQVVSKYIGETEKNLDRVFDAAETANAVLFFDEADALFGKRSEVKDAHDRYSNLEIAYLLQKMEQFAGLAILATNLRQNIDDAFARRVTVAVNFPLPEVAERQRLWAAHWPPRLRCADDVDLDEFAERLPLPGGNIRNLVLAAAHYAAADGGVVDRRHLLHATRREFQKLGKSLAEADWRRLGLAEAAGSVT